MESNGETFELLFKAKTLERTIKMNSGTKSVKIIKPYSLDFAKLK